MNLQADVSEQGYSIEPLHIFDRRGKPSLRYNIPQILYAEGGRGAGKSMLLEHFALNYLSHGCVVFDMFGAADSEGLAWLRAPFINDINVLLLKGENVDVECDWDVIEAGKLSLNDFTKYDLIISARALYRNKDEEYYAIGQATNVLYSRLYWNRVIFWLVREASGLWASRVIISKRQTDTIKEADYVLKESRHLGIALGLDSLRYTSVDKDIRLQSDYMFFKACGIEGLPDEMKWLYSFFNPHWIQNMKPWQFIIVDRRGPLGAGWCPELPWHKKEGENIVRQLGINIEFGELIDHGKDKGTFKTLSDPEHADIIALYLEKDIGMNKIADQIKRCDRTVNLHIRKHNSAIDRSGFCPRCKRTKSKYQNIKAERHFSG